ncbi:coiled-coil domain-containing protein 191 isoform X2 [Cynoglossus semilaevis]|uniref:coiled-coil domain-containing protein 191 isoform X2 n=1 Tax=Cynoglossus semilaevis TaxID=244447 RepID=UPI0007DC9B4B|nr:coiled-coil domain-containing protein 191 isoform X2 [Cynoglossus semilaevis]
MCLCNTANSYEIMMKPTRKALVGDWLSSNLQMEAEMDEVDDIMSSVRRKRPALNFSHLTAPSYDNFEDLYNCLAEEDMHITVNNVLQDLMEQDLLDTGMMEELALDVGKTKKKIRDPLITMEARHQLVRENRAQRDTERQKQQREREALRAAREEVKRRELEEEKRRNQDAHREEEMVQQEMVRLRRQMEEQKRLKQLVRQRERQRTGQRSEGDLQSTPTPTPSPQQQQVTKRQHRKQKIQSIVQMNNLKCLHRHFSGWYSVVLDQRLRMGKATALSNWKRQLRAWRVWRLHVWAEQKHKEVLRIKEELQTECRQSQLAVDSNRRRLLRLCFNEWHRCCWTEKRRRELFSKQQEIRRKMAALILAVSTGKLKATEDQAYQPTMSSSPQTSDEPETTEEDSNKRSGSLTPDASAVHLDQTPADAVDPQPTEPWQVTRKQAAPTPAELNDVRQKFKGNCSKTAASKGSRFENRHAAQQQIISQQKKLLKEQQEEIIRLKEEQSVMKNVQVLQQGGLKARSHNPDSKGQRTLKDSEKPDIPWSQERKCVRPQGSPHPIISAMEARAHQRSNRKKEIEELKRKKEQEKLAEMKAAEDQRVREELEEKRKMAEKRKEEKRLQREREEEKQRELKRLQECLKLACNHYNRTLLLRRGLAPWKRLIQLREANTELAESHYNRFLLKQCALRWQQSARESLSEKEAAADQLHRRFVLWSSFSSWKRLVDLRTTQEEQAEHFYRTHTLRRFLLALLDHVTQERLVQWDRQELAHEHNNRRVLQRCLLAWKQLPRVLRKEKEKEERRKKLGRTVLKVLPDFSLNPP